MGKFYWLKLKNDYFSQPKIKKLRRIAGGDTYTIIYLKMQLLSLQNDGRLYFEGIEDNFIEEMALTLDEDVENVSVTVQYLLRQGLLEAVSDDEYMMNETKALIGSETPSAARVRKHRENQKALQCNTNVTKCNTEIEIENRDRVRDRVEIEKSENNSAKPKAPIKHKYGEFKHVLLTDEERDRLFKDKGEELTLKAIKKLDEYIEETGKRYKNHNLTLRRWVFDAVNEKKAPKAFENEMDEWRNA